MTDHHDDHDDHDRRDDDGPDRSGFGGLFGDLDRLLRRLQELDDAGALSGTGQFDRDDIHVDYHFEVSEGLGPGSRGRKGHPRFGTAGDGRSNRSRGTTDVANPTEAADDADFDPHYDVRQEGTETTVTIDLSGAHIRTTDDLEVTLEDGALIVSRENDPLVRTALDDAGAVTDVSLNNGILEIKLV